VALLALVVDLLLLAGMEHLELVVLAVLAQQMQFLAHQLFMLAAVVVEFI
jgi:hypothetical protein